VEPLIAVVDDDASVLRALTRLLRSAGFAVEAFGSGDDLLAWDRLGTVDCLVLDVHLGGLTGFELQERLAAMQAAPPIVFITADEEVAARERARRGADGQCLSKPVDAASLIGAIRDALDRRPGPDGSAEAAGA
jgi:FixJ family two-component response regulator